MDSKTTSTDLHQKIRAIEKLPFSGSFSMARRRKKREKKKRRKKKKKEKKEEKKGKREKKKEEKRKKKREKEKMRRPKNLENIRKWLILVSAPVVFLTVFGVFVALSSVPAASAVYLRRLSHQESSPGGPPEEAFSSRGLSRR